MSSESNEQPTFACMTDALDYYDEEYRKKGQAIPFSTLFSIVNTKILKEEIRIQPLLLAKRLDSSFFDTVPGVTANELGK